LSRLNVDELAPKTAGKKILMPQGGIIQTQYTQYTSTSTVSIASGTDTAIDNLAVNITPMSTSSIIRIDAMVNGEWSNQTASYNSVWFFYRGSTKLSGPAAGSRDVGVLMGTSLTYESSESGSTPEHAIYSFFDTPSTTSQITYKVGFRQGTGSTITWYHNKTVTDSDGIQYERGTSFISVTEIAG